MNVSPAILGLIRTVAYVGGFAALTAVLGFFSDATHLNGVVNPSIALLIAAVAGSIEHSIEAKSGKALFGLARTN